MSSQVDFAIAFGITISLVFILLGYIYSDAGRIIEDVNTRELESSSEYIFDSIIENSSVNYKTTYFYMYDKTGAGGNKNVNISFEFNTIPSKITLYDSFMNNIDFDMYVDGSYVYLNFSYFFNGSEEEKFRIYFDRGSIENASSLSSDIEGRFISERNVTIFSVRNLNDIDYNSFLKFTKHRFRLSIPGILFGENPTGNVVVSKKSLLVLYENGTVVPVVGKIEVW